MITAKPIYQWTSKEVLEYFQKLDRRSRVRIFAFVGGGLFGILFILWPAWVKRPEIQSQVSSLRSQIQLAEAQVHQEPKLLEERKAYQTFVRETQSRLLTEQEREGLLGILAQAGKKSQVSLLSTQPQDYSDKLPAAFAKKYAAVAYVITVEGGYHSLATFVSEMESYPKLLRVEGFTVSPQEKNPRIHLSQIHILAFTIREGQTKGI